LFAGEAGTWEAAGVAAPTVEGPFMELRNGIYYLFFSGGSYKTTYGMGYATASSPTGPFTQSPANPIFANTSAVFDPGGGDEFVVGPHGGLWMLYAARAAAGASRTLRLDGVSWQAGTEPGAPLVPNLSSPTATLQRWQP
jgi:beta-xylosidase